MKTLCLSLDRIGFNRPLFSRGIKQPMKTTYRSEEWKRHRIQTIKAHGDCQCENDLCPNKGQYLPVAVHHIHYSNGTFGPPNDFQILCLECHAVAELQKAQNRRQWDKMKRCHAELRKLRSEPQLYMDFLQSQTDGMQDAA